MPNQQKNASRYRMVSNTNLLTWGSRLMLVTHITYKLSKVLKIILTFSNGLKLLSQLLTGVPPNRYPGYLSHIYHNFTYTKLKKNITKLYLNIEQLLLKLHFIIITIILLLFFMRLWVPEKYKKNYLPHSWLLILRMRISEKKSRRSWAKDIDLII